MTNAFKHWQLYLFSGVICISMVLLSSAPGSSAGAASRPFPVFFLEFLVLFLLVCFLVAAIARIFRSTETTFAFLSFFLAGILWAPAIASPFLGMDTLTVFRIENLFSIFIAEGRPVTGLILVALKDFGFFSPAWLKGCMTLGVFMLALGMTFFWEACVRQTQRTSPFDKTLLGVGIGAVFFAPLMVVVQAFPILMLPWLTGLTALIFAVVLLMKGKGWKAWGGAVLLVCLCANTYQTFVGFFIPLALLSAARLHGAWDEQGRMQWRKFLLFFAGLCGVVIFSLGVSFFCAKVLSPMLGNANIRAVGSLDIPGNALEIFRSLKLVYFHLFGIFFPGFLPLSILFAAGVIFFYDHWKLKRLPLLFLLFLSLAMLFCTSILLQLFVSEVWINDRSAIPCSASAGLAAFTLLFFFRGDAFPEVFRKVAATLGFLLIAATVSTNIMITVRMHESEMSDYYEAREILRKIENYEQKNKVRIETVELHFRPHYSRRNRPGNFPCAKITEKLEQDTKLFCTPWKIPPYFEHYFHRRLQVKRNPVQDPATIRRWEKDKCWSDSNYDEQLVFEGATVHLLNF